MTFGEKIRESRITLKLTQKQLADKIGAKHNSISDWENDKNKPDPNTIELLCGVLNISPNYLLGTSSDDFSLYEKEIIKKYRALDEHGKKMVDFTLQEEYERSNKIRLEQLDEAKKRIRRMNALIPQSIEFINDANPPQPLEDIVAEDWGPETDEWVYQLEQFRNNNVAYINSYTDLETKRRAQAIIDEERGQLKAAHNDHEDEPGELDKMQEDIAGLKRPE